MLDRQVLRPRSRVRIDIGRVVRWLAVVSALVAFLIDRRASRLEAERAGAEARAEAAIAHAHAQLAALRTTGLVARPVPIRDPIVHPHGSHPIHISRGCMENPLSKDCQ